MARYRKKPVVIEAWQWRGEPAGALPGVCQCDSNTYPHLHTAHENTINDRGQLVFLSDGDWIIPESKKPGRYYPCKPDVFAETYDLVTEPDAVAAIAMDAMVTGMGVSRVEPGGLYLTPEEQEIALAAGALSDEEIAALTRDELQLSRECGDNV